MPRKIGPKYGIDPVQRVRPFMFSDQQKEQLLEKLAPVKGDRAEIIARLSTE